ncbi:hypothetical protein BGZ61DRAFT_457505 [Ilyonectria robusta]|uniref:uncharacterized protein n=1 Tax=Ilyonectria robusta TaxID=1079257 RepID=UPI001E8E1CCF|nr:uncharacterized protein BGZ61DRAFT_457505 [Ilyonectria robusta]KAH8677048.1 hypothetical protein BGZ61DRAFT_457505 [Ilyonectria robusta]
MSPHLNPLLTRNNNPSPPTYPTRKSRPSIRIQPKKPHIAPNQTPSVNEPIHVISKPIKTKINKNANPSPPLISKKGKLLIISSNHARPASRKRQIDFEVRHPRDPLPKSQSPPRLFLFLH